MKTGTPTLIYKTYRFEKDEVTIDLVEKLIQ
jgi:hypothetical protein